MDALIFWINIYPVQIFGTVIGVFAYWATPLIAVIVRNKVEKKYRL